MTRQSKFTTTSSSSKMLKEHKNPYIRLITKYQLKYKAVKAAVGTWEARPLLPYIYADKKERRSKDYKEFLVSSYFLKIKKTPSTKGLRLCLQTEGTYF